jgi:hypothetical protein
MLLKVMSSPYVFSYMHSVSALAENDPEKWDTRPLVRMAETLTNWFIDRGFSAEAVFQSPKMRLHSSLFVGACDHDVEEGVAGGTADISTGFQNPKTRLHWSMFEGTPQCDDIEDDSISEVSDSCGEEEEKEGGADGEE